MEYMYCLEILGDPWEAAATAQQALQSSAYVCDALRASSLHLGPLLNARWALCQNSTELFLSTSLKRLNAETWCLLPIFSHRAFARPGVAPCLEKHQGPILIAAW
jgi:hypothetical protein